MRKNKDAIKMSTKKAIQNFKGNNYLQTDDVKQLIITVTLNLMT